MIRAFIVEAIVQSTAMGFIGLALSALGWQLWPPLGVALGLAVGVVVVLYLGLATWAALTEAHHQDTNRMEELL